MTYLPTDWEARITPLFVKDAQGKPLVVTLMGGSDDVVAMELAAVLDPGEPNPVDPESTLLQLRAITELEDADKTTDFLTGGAEVHGTQVWQRIHDLERGRWYAWEVLHGDPGNRRGNSMMIHCPE